MMPVALFLAAGCLAMAPAELGNYRPVKEPVYQSKSPNYGLLVFGREGQERVWLVRDGDTLYVDRRGDGDLTRPEAKVAAEKKPGQDPKEDGYTFEVGDVTVAGRTHKGLTVGFVPLKRYAEGSLGKRADVKAALAKDANAMAVILTVDAVVPGIKGGGIDGRVGFMAGPIDLNGVLQFADSPADAPAVRLGGPLQVTFYAELPQLRVGRGSEFVLVVGSPGVGPGTLAKVKYQDTIPESAKPLVEMSLPSAKATGPLRDKVFLKDRC
jgi:hypothetical protein